MLETLLIALLFLGALAYLGNGVRKAFSRRRAAGCAKGCGSCAAANEVQKSTHPERLTG